MKAIITALVFGLVSSAHADDRIDMLCKGKDIVKPSVCVQVIKEQLDAAYAWGEENAHLIKRHKLVKREEFLQSEPMLRLCKSAPDHAKCEMFRSYLVEEYDAGIGL